MTSILPRPKVIETVDGLREAVAGFRRKGKTIGLVPTMGALHAGHLSLVEAAKAECDVCLVTIYVNPSQFGPGEDLDRYPRALEADLDALSRYGVELAFVPQDGEVYMPGHATWVEVGSLSEPLEGKCRPGHFRGVATIVLKLFNMACADVAYFGQKDYQQAAVIRRMVADLNVPIEIRICPTVREPDGLAMSSRNVYLEAGARAQSLVLWKSLCLAEELVRCGQRDASVIAERIRQAILSAPDAKIEYAAVVDAITFEPVRELRGRALVALAVKFGVTRLIDNCLLEPPE
jgi:pantoate--beta-alanine ligase